MSNNTIKIHLSKQEVDTVWQLLYKARDCILQEYGNNCLTDLMGGMMDKFIYPDESTPAEEGEYAARKENIKIMQELKIRNNQDQFKEAKHLEKDEGGEK